MAYLRPERWLRAKYYKLSNYQNLPWGRVVARVVCFDSVVLTGQHVVNTSED